MYEMILPYLIKSVMISVIVEAFTVFTSKRFNPRITVPVVGGLLVLVTTEIDWVILAKEFVLNTSFAFLFYVYFGKKFIKKLFEKVNERI